MKKSKILMFSKMFPGFDETHEKLMDIIERKIFAGDIRVIHNSISGDIPIIYARGRCLPEAWENSLIALFAFGETIETQYDRVGDPMSLDSSMIMIIDKPESEPMIHRSFPGGLEDLEEYRQEVVDGVKNHWIRNPEDPNDHRWEYTYNERMFSYKVPGIKKPINQFETMARTIAESPITRRAQMVSWQPWMDAGAYDPACWQSLWGRISKDNMTGNERLNLNMRFRSRDAYKAAFMNDFAFIDLGRKLAKRISELRGTEVTLGRFVDSSDSYHIYGSYFEEFVNSFLKLLVNREKFSDRTWTTEFCQPFFDDAKPAIKQKIAEQDAKYKTLE